MAWLTDELLFYGGMVTAAITAVAALLYFCIWKIRKTHLDVRLDEEYGKRKK